MARLKNFISFNKYWKMDANVAIIASGLKQVLNIPISLDKNFQGTYLDLQQLHNSSLIRKDTAKKLYTVRPLQRDSSNILPRQFQVFIKTLTGKTILIDVNKNDFLKISKYQWQGRCACYTTNTDTL